MSHCDPEWIARAEQSWSRLRGEWHSVADEARDEADGDVDGDAAGNAVLRRWQSRLDVMRAEQREMVASGAWLAGPCDLLTILGRSRREVDHCSILAWLLDPGMPHRLESRLLQRLLYRCFGSGAFASTSLSSAVSRTEVCRARSRADIVVSAPGLTLVVEAKIDHVERPEQCADLIADYSEEPGGRFVFLTVDGRAATSKRTDAGEEFVPLRFSELREDLEAVLQELPEDAPPAAHATILSYLQTLRSEFP